ncbi:MAG: peptide chain release factor 2 [Peptostreptococcaceae bacterium]|jgi:peptide chain release factor 2|nr:peptide chain release factor 2 [Peptostreptococcaceae bacterium]
MLNISEYTTVVEEAKIDINELKEALKINILINKIKDNENEMLKEDFWSDNEKASLILQENKNLKEIISEFNELNDLHEEIELSVEVLKEDEEYLTKEELDSLVNRLKKELEKMKIKSLLDGEFDKNNAILSINAGTGGLDAQDWAQMLLRMYSRWSSNKSFKTSILDFHNDKEGGIKSATILVEGLNAYGFLKGEKGVHRLVRISPFDSSGKRHTSFASVDVVPEITDDIELDINPNDLRIDTYRASGAGGQHVNTTDSAVRITHIPTNIVVQCQNQRSQHSNKETALKMLKAKLIELKELERKEKIEDLQGEYSQIAWGSQIRSYVFQPYTLVKDHRTNFEIGNVNSVVDGNIDDFVNEYLKYIKK